MLMPQENIYTKYETGFAEPSCKLPVYSRFLSGELHCQVLYLRNTYYVSKQVGSNAQLVIKTYSAFVFTVVRPIEK
jgi:hypothetical protein